MENLIQKIWHKEFGSVRVVILNGKVYFVGKDIAKCLGFKDTDKTIRNRVEAADKIVFDANKEDFKSSLCGDVKLSNGAILINESGLWSLVIHSRLPKAREFQHWLTAEVIPQIARTGKYLPADNPAFNPLKDDFTPRERVEMLFKLLNFNLPQSLKNKIANQIFIELSPDYSDFWEKLLEQAQAE